MGCRIWEAILAWQVRQAEMQRMYSWPNEYGHSHRQETEWNGKQEPEQRERESRQQEDFKQKETEREKIWICHTSKSAEQFNNVAGQQASKSLANDGLVPGLWTIYEDHRDDKKIPW